MLLGTMYSGNRFYTSRVGQGEGCGMTLQVKAHSSFCA